MKNAIAEYYRKYLALVLAAACCALGARRREAAKAVAGAIRICLGSRADD